MNRYVPDLKDQEMSNQPQSGYPQTHPRTSSQTEHHLARADLTPKGPTSPHGQSDNHSMPGILDVIPLPPVTELNKAQKTKLRRPQSSRLTSYVPRCSSCATPYKSPTCGTHEGLQEAAVPSQNPMGGSAVPLMQVPDRNLEALHEDNVIGYTADALQDALGNLAAEPVSNIAQLQLIQTALQPHSLGQQRLASLAQYLSRVLPSTVAADPRSVMQIRQAKLEAIMARSSQQSQLDQAAEESRVGLAVLMIYLWSHKLKLDLALQDDSVSADAHGKATEAAAAATPASSSATAASSSTHSFPATTASQASCTAANMTDGVSGATAAASPAAPAGASQAAPAISSWADHMSLTESDAEVEEDPVLDSTHTSSGALWQTSLHAVVTTATSQLRKYQQDVLDAIKDGGNHIVVAPTGITLAAVHILTVMHIAHNCLQTSSIMGWVSSRSGKTRIAVELAGILLQRKPQAKIVFLANTVALAEQQAEVFKRANCMQLARVQCFTKSGRMNPKRWRIAICIDSILVMTAQQLLNNLAVRAASLQQIDLLILDECHHCLKESPYNLIMRYYKALSEQEQANTQVLGLTATPGGDIDVAGARKVQWRLKDNMCSSFIRVDPAGVEVARLVPRATDQVIKVQPRAEDAVFSANLACVLLDHVEGLVVQMTQQVPGMLLPVSKTRTDLTAGRWSPDLKAWFKHALDPAHDFSAFFTAYLKLLRDCNTAVLLTNHHGFEVALHFLASRCINAVDAVQASAVCATKESLTEPSDVVTTLLADLAKGACSVAMACRTVKAMQDSTFVGFPKFKALVTVLHEMVESKSSFHGIVFVRQQQGVDAVASLLRHVPELAKLIQFHTITGHSAKSKTQMMRDGSDHMAAGMPTNKQQETLLQFKQATGRQILVATAAAQEGLDIVNCSFVVCYNVTECGVQLMQWRGRTRMFDSQILIIMEAGSQDEVLFSKACMEEANDRLAQLYLPSVH